MKFISTNRLISIFVPALAIVFTTACTDDNESDTTIPDGVYAVNAYSETSGSCDSSQLVSTTARSEHFFVSRKSFFGTYYYFVAGCNDLAECETNYGKHRRNESFSLPYSYTVLDAPEEGVFQGETVFSGYNMGGTCTDGKVEAHELEFEKNKTITLTNRTTFAANHAVDSEGFCTTDGAKAATTGVPCSSMSVLRGDLVKEY